MLSDLESISLALSKAKAPEDVFGPVADSHALTSLWRRLMKLTHPDRYDGDPKATELAKKAFSAINVWKAQAEAKIALGTYGNGKAHTMPVAEAPTEPVTVTIGRTTYVTGDALFQGDIATLYACSSSHVSGSHVFKIARSAADNDLMEAEQQALSSWRRETTAGDGRLLPTLIDSFLLKGRGPARRVNVLSRHDDHHSLGEVMRVYPDGIDFRDFAWMFKRALTALGFAHRKGFVHGAVLPPHLLVHPIHHGAKLVGWGGSVPMGRSVRVAVGAYKSAFYAPEVTRKGPATPATDLYMLAKCAVHLLGGNAATAIMPDRVPRPIQAFFLGCLLAAPVRRPQDAWALLDEFNDLLARVVGPRAYRPFHMPARIA